MEETMWLVHHSKTDTYYYDHSHQDYVKEENDNVEVHQSIYQGSSGSIKDIWLWVFKIESA